MRTSACELPLAGFGLIGRWWLAVAVLTTLGTAEAPPARAAVLLTGDYIQLPIDNSILPGRFMAEGDAQGGKFNAAGTGGAAGVDFWQPGSPVYNYTIAVGGTTFLVNGGSWVSAPVVSDSSTGSLNSATITGSPVAGLEFSRVVSFADGDQVVTITDTLTNTGAVAVPDVATLDNTDPDQNDFTTLNDVIAGAVFARASSGTLTLAFGSANALSVADASGFDNTNPYPIIAAPSDPNGASGDIGINLAVNYGTLSAGQAVSVTWYIVFGADLASAEANYCSAVGAVDTDGDGVCDALDNCPAIANANQANCDGDALGDACDPDATDLDGDGVICDNCPSVSNPGQADTDGDGFGDACDACVGPGAADGDGDTICDGIDNCPAVANPDQADADFDGVGNVCDPCFGFGSSDGDGDGICDANDNCPAVPNPGQSNCDFDALGDACDPDAVDPDGDGVANPCDNCPTVSNPGQADSTGDGTGDACDQGNLDTTGCYRAADTIGPPDGSEPTFSFIDISASGTR